MKRGQTDLSGILLVDKPSGPSSHDVINRLRAVTGERRIGHAGTLDPLASGLLIVMIGPATRLSDYFLMKDKTYVTEIMFGTATDTDDAAGEVIATAKIPEQVCDLSYATQTLQAWIGCHDQMPPRYSAIKVNGRKSYDVARAGGDLSLSPRSIEVFESELISIEKISDEAVIWKCQFRVSKGTYVRSLARDIGVGLGTCAHVISLSRVASGAACIGDAYTLDELMNCDAISITSRFVDPLPLMGFPGAAVDSEGAQRVLLGKTLDHADISLIRTDAAYGSQTDENLMGILYEDTLIALYHCDDVSGTLKPRVVFPGGVHAQIC